LKSYDDGGFFTLLPPTLTRLLIAWIFFDKIFLIKTQELKAEEQQQQRRRQIRFS